MSEERRNYRKGLVMTVGEGRQGETKQYIRALAVSIRDPNPDIVVLIASEQSYDKVGTHVEAEYQEQFGAEGPEFIHRIVRDPDSLHETFHASLEAIRDLRARGLAKQSIDVNYTGGTKTMSISAALAMIAADCSGKLWATVGPRKGGTVISGAEETRPFAPGPIVAVHRLDLAEEMIRRLQFTAAINICETVLEPHLTEADCRRRDMLVRVAQAFDAWDKFDHQRAAELFLKIEKDQLDCGPFALEPRLHRRIDHIGKIANPQNPRRFGRDLVADLFANAERRILQGEWDDAVGRLYRCTEMLAQMVLLHEYSLDTSDALGESGCDAVRRAAREVLDGKAPNSEGKVVAGLVDSYRILAQVGHQLGAAWESSDSNVKELLSARNKSLLAHGTTPIDGKTAVAFRDRVRALAQVQISDFAERVHAVQFPWLRSSG